MSTGLVLRLNRRLHGAALTALAACFAAGGCTPASTEINSFVDPEFADRIYSRVLIAPKYADLGDRTAIEEAFVGLLADTEAEGVPSLSILLPTRDWKDEEIFKLMAEHQIDAVLIINQTDSYQDREYVPERVDIHTDEFLTARSFRGGRRWGYGRGYYNTRVTRSGGYYVDLPRVRNELRLYDVASKKQAWFATSLTAGDSSATREEMIDSFAREAVARLTFDGLVRPLPKRSEEDEGNDDEDD